MANTGWVFWAGGNWKLIQDALPRCFQGGPATPGVWQQYLGNEADLPAVEGEGEGLPLHLCRRLCDGLELQPLRRGEVWKGAGGGEQSGVGVHMHTLSVPTLLPVGVLSSGQRKRGTFW